MIHIASFVEHSEYKMSQCMSLWYLGEPAHPRSLTRAFAVRTQEVWK